MNKVYKYGSYEVVFEGSNEECWGWLMAHAPTLLNGNKFYRTWIEENSEGLYDTVYDVGSLYIFNK